MSWEDVQHFLDRVLNYTLFQIKETPVNTLSVLIFLVLITAFILFAVFVRKALNRKILRRFRIDPGTSYTLSRHPVCDHHYRRAHLLPVCGR